ncbi:mitochondrial K+-H+ exchange-related-domain-containing protein [Mycena galopus ATCC 62051]|nr:mitochondrial K+-H+ exchange-related-domain-containing protein [Mycena galopus ATCC 62051]
MASLQRTWGTMRIVALPLTRAAPPQRVIAYYSFRVFPPPTPPSHKDSQPPGWLPKEGVVKWASYKLDTMWSGWGNAKTGTWRFRVFEFGERFLDRLDFEEGALKRIDVKNAPPASVPKDLTGVELEEAEAAWAKLQVPLVYPPSISSGPSALSDLRNILQTRIPQHNRGFWTFLLIAPLTAPFMIVPIIPNLPFFFCAWRAWSHYQALRGARHVDALLQNGKIIPTPDTTLDAVYAEAAADSKEADTPANSKNTGRMIVTRGSLQHAMRALEMKPDEAKDVLRAYEQAMNRIR